MATTRMRFALPYEPETQIGRAIGSMSNALFGGPTAYQVEAQQAERDAHRATAALKTNELEGRTALGDIYAKWTAAMSDPTTREAMFKTYAPQLAETAARYGYDPGKAVELFRFSMATPQATEQNRAFGTYATKGEVGNYASFGDLGAQRAAEGRKTADETRIRSAAAAAGNPEGVVRAAALRANLAGPDGRPDYLSPAGRIAARLEPMPSETEMRERRQDRALDRTPTERGQYELLNSQLQTFMRQSPSPSSAMAQFERAFPGGLKKIADFQTKMMAAQSRPPVRGAQVVDGRAFVPNPYEPGRLVEAKRDGAGWYFEYRGKRYDLEQPDYR